MVLLSTHNICFGWKIKKIVFQYTLLSGGLVTTLTDIKPLQTRLPTYNVTNITSTPRPTPYPLTNSLTLIKQTFGICTKYKCTKILCTCPNLMDQIYSSQDPDTLKSFTYYRQADICKQAHTNTSWHNHIFKRLPVHACLVLILTLALMIEHVHLQSFTRAFL